MHGGSHVALHSSFWRDATAIGRPVGHFLEPFVTYTHSNPFWTHPEWVRQNVRMAISKVIEGNLSESPLLHWRRAVAFGFLYWLAFVLVLEPGNLLRTIESGHAVTFDHEVLRITAAGMLGAIVTPIALTLARRFLVFGGGKWRHLLVLVAGISILGVILVVISCFLAAWMFERKLSPSIEEIRDQLTGNALLLMCALFALSGIDRAIRLYRRTDQLEIENRPDPWSARIPIKTRGLSGSLSLADIDWIESQGNYVALHAGPSVHMIRETSINFEAKLDPNRFVRIHRRFLVAIDRIQELRPLTNGDVIVRLIGGIELRASRRYREAIRKRRPSN